MKLPQLIEDPPTEDSPNFTEEEANSALKMESLSELSSKLIETLKSDTSLVLQGHELLHRGDSSYWRTTLKSPEGGHKVLIFRTDWLGA